MKIENGKREGVRERNKGVGKVTSLVDVEKTRAFCCGDDPFVLYCCGGVFIGVIE